MGECIVGPRPFSTSRQVPAFRREDARHDPVAASGGAVVRQVGERCEVLPCCVRGPTVRRFVARRKAVDLAEHPLHVGLLLRALGPVVPCQIENRSILRAVDPHTDASAGFRDRR